MSPPNGTASVHTNGHGHAANDSTTTWWKDAIVYQIYPSTFKDSTGTGVGDLKGIFSKLEYIQSLGVNTLWICPFYKSPQYDLGYDIADYTNIHEGYGDLSDLDDIVAAADKLGLRVLADLVINHSSHQHRWFEESRSSKDNPKRDWYMWRPAKYVDGKREPPNNWRGAFGDSCWTWDEHTEEYYFHVFLAEQPDLNWENPVTRQAIYDDAIRFWLKRGLAGFRVDTVNMYSKHLDFPDAPIVNPHTKFQPCWDFVCNGPRLHEFLKEMRKEALGNCVTIGELPNTPKFEDVFEVVSAKSGMLDMVLQFDIANLTRMGWGFMITPWKLSTLKHFTHETQRLADPTKDAWACNYIGNHDQARAVSRFGSDDPQFRVASAKMLVTYQLGLSGTPIIYQGDEIGMVNIPKSWDIDVEYKDCDTIGFMKDVREAIAKEHNDSLLPAAIAGAQLSARDHARTPMQWDTSPNSGFSTAKSTWMRVNDSYKEINVASQESDPSSVLAYYREMIALRKKHIDVFAHGSFHPEEQDAAIDESVYVYTKVNPKGTAKAVVVLNWTKEEQTYELPAGSEKLKVVLESGEQPGTGRLAPFGAKVYM